MEHTPAESLTWSPAPTEHFTGRVWFGPLSRADDRPLNATGVLFEPGARTDWHSHPEGQVLYVVSGAGRAGIDGGEVVDLGPGDVVHTPSGERHWHGAASASYMMHLSLTTGPATRWDTDKVSDEEYGAM